MKVQKKISHKQVTAPEAISKIRKGSRVFIGSGCGEPRHLIRTLARSTEMQDIMLYQMLSLTLAEYMDDADFLERFSLKLFFISAGMRKAAFEGKIDYIPAYLSEIPELFDSNQIGLDVALIQVSPPDRFGYCSLGISVDVTRAGCKNARTVIAQVNPNMPRTCGDTFVHVDEIDWLVFHEEPLAEAVPDIPDEEVARRIAFYVSDLVEDGATLQVGFGRLPYVILECLGHKNDLGIHTQMITDAYIPLFENGIINNRKKTFMPERAVATLCMGSRKVYDYVDNNPMFYFRSSDFVNDPAIVALNDNLISISSALEVDLTGQVCADSVGHLFYSGIGDQANFIRGAAMSKGGFSIIALPSTAKNGTVSRIVPNLSEGAGVATLRGDVNFVVTEYGIAQLRGKSIYQRVIELTQIAHPDFRSALIESAKSYHYIFSDQLAPRAEDQLFLEKYKSRMQLKNGKSMAVRPILPADEFAYRNFFYSLREETIYYRFFKKIRLFTHEMAQKHWANVDYRKNMSLIGLVQNRGHKEIMAVATYAEDQDNRAEVAFLVRENLQGMGIASYLLEKLEAIARENGYTGFSATVLPENRAMIRVFQKRYPGLTTRLEEGNILILMNFDLPDEERHPAV
ncbi:acetyl-CoA hydrolase [Desulfonema ishimotonii]|uniref:Acetyl-CoA hydrolase n=1 Tax=Desulfonema ishimotonii TaxID=45657 RepID=A0A401FRR9_9BACT|nr:bifunctional acetyl-CoA hydrolase/transferase family protein/GNAT family N-acetyltransferase [Desulfonema ishimotonii]GBC59669.1 acetyl-CoA hydrolase [Desulfonema ishimotonii]